MPFPQIKREDMMILNINPFGYGHGMPIYGYGGPSGAMVAILVLVAVIAAIVVRLTFLSPRNEGRFTGFLGALYDFLNFRTGILRGLLLSLYLIFCFGQIALSLAMLFSGNLLGGLVMLVVGQIALRLAYEMFLLMVNLCYNVMDINRKLDYCHPPQTPVQPHVPATPEDPTQRPEF